LLSRTKDLPAHQHQNARFCGELYTCDNAESLPDEAGVLPDHFVPQSVADYFAGKDAVKEYTLGLIRK
jgi:hypothetical protein